MSSAHLPTVGRVVDVQRLDDLVRNADIFPLSWGAQRRAVSCYESDADHVRGRDVAETSKLTEEVSALRLQRDSDLGVSLSDIMFGFVAQHEASRTARAFRCCNARAKALSK